ncbi:hypothetical protein YC2023_006456 [Brassica napus]
MDVFTDIAMVTGIITLSLMSSRAGLSVLLHHSQLTATIIIQSLKGSAYPFCKCRSDCGREALLTLGVFPELWVKRCNFSRKDILSTPHLADLVEDQKLF